MCSRKSKPPESGHSPGVLLCLLALAVTIKPLADEIANYIRSDRHKDTSEDFQGAHLLSVARLEKGSTIILSHTTRKS